MIAQHPTGPIVVTPAAEYPVTLGEAKTYCLIDGSAGDNLVGHIAAATELVQKLTGRQLVSATLKQVWDNWPCGQALRLDLWPVSSVTHVKYYDVDGTQQTVSSANYWASLNYKPAAILPRQSYTWPTVQDGRPEAIEVQYVAGHASAAAVPQMLKLAVLALVKLWYDHPNPAIATGAVPQELPWHLRELLAVNDRTGYS